MVDALVLGSGPVGLTTAILLAGRGLDVTVLDRDEVETPTGAEEAWERWQRPGVAQFRQAHLLLPGGYRVLCDHLPGVVDALVASHGGRLDLTGMRPPHLPLAEGLTDDARVVTVNARRPVLEQCFASVAAATPGVEIRRGVEVESFVVGPSAVTGAPHVSGIRTSAGEELTAGVVVDATGRRSNLSARLVAAGARPPEEHRESDGFVYYTRFYRRSDGTVPPPLAPLLSPIGSFSVLFLPSDNGTWCVTLYASAADQDMRAVRDPEVFDRVLGACPRHAHLIDGEPLGGVAVMSSILGRRRSMMVDGVPVSTGVLPVGDAWAFTNPSLGRGITLGLRHAVAVADIVNGSLDLDPAAQMEMWQEVTEAEMRPWQEATLAVDRVRVAEMNAARAGLELPFDPTDQGAVIGRAFRAAIERDAEAFDANLLLVSCLALPRDVFGRPGFIDRILAVADGAGPTPFPGPDRSALVRLLHEQPTMASPR